MFAQGVGPDSKVLSSLPAALKIRLRLKRPQEKECFQSLTSPACSSLTLSEQLTLGSCRLSQARGGRPAAGWSQLPPADCAPPQVHVH